MINAPKIVSDFLKFTDSDNIRYANLIAVNLGDAYGTGNDVVLHLTDYVHTISFDGNTYTPDNNLVDIDGISRKASTGSDSVDIVFAVTDEVLIDAIKSKRYINKPTTINRVIMDSGNVVGDFAIPVRTAWGLTHGITGDIEDRAITLTIDSSLGDLDGDNGWYAVNASHEQRHPGDKIMRHGQTVMTGDQQKKYTSNFSGVINQQIKPPSLSKIYGYKNVELVPICMLKHRKTHSSFRHYFTTIIYVINIGDCNYVDINNLRKDGEAFDFTRVLNNDRDVGGWSARVRTPLDALGTSIVQEDGNDLNFFFEGMDSAEKSRFNGMIGKGLTLLFVKNRNRDDWLRSAPKMTLPVQSSKVLDTRTGQVVYSRNPALQYADFLRSTEYGAGKRGIPVLDSNISDLANHFDQIPDSIGTPGIDSILIDVQVDTGSPIVDNMNIWMEGTRLYTSDYYGTFSLRVETSSATSIVIDEDDLEAYPEYEEGDFTERRNQLTYSIKQLVPDTTEPGKLVEVDVEATFPPDGSLIHTDWLGEDGGIHNFDSEQLSYVTELEQAYYWAMVDARISRQPRTLDISVGPIGWLSEVGDVIDFSSVIMSMTNELWRVDEVSEDDNEVWLKLVAYDANFYTPDPDAIPAPVALAQPPTAETLSPVSGMAITESVGKYFLSWDPVSSANVAWYAVQITVDGDLVYDDPKVAQPPFLLESIVVGDYTATITTVGISDEGGSASLSFSVAAPIVPTINAVANIFDIEISPTVAQFNLGGAFDLRIGLTNVFADSTSKGRSGSFTVSVNPGTKYYLWVRTTNPIGESAWVSTNVTTSNDPSLIIDFITPAIVLGVANFDQDVNDLLDDAAQVPAINIEITKLQNVESTIGAKYDDVFFDSLAELSGSALRTAALAQEFTGLESFVFTVSEDLQQLVLDSQTVTPSGWTAIRFEVDGLLNQFSVLAIEQEQHAGQLVTIESQLTLNTDQIELLIQSTELGDVSVKLDQLRIDLDIQANQITTQALSIRVQEFDDLAALTGAILSAHDTQERVKVDFAIVNETMTARAEEAQSIAESTELLAAQFQGNAAGLSETREAVVNVEQARVIERKEIQAQFETERSVTTAEIIRLDQTVADAESASASSIAELEAVVDTDRSNNAASVATLQQADANQDSANALSISTLQAQIDSDVGTLTAMVNNNASAIVTKAEQTALNSLSATVTTATSDIASANLVLNAHNDDINGLSARAYFGVSVNNRISGVHIAGSPTESIMDFSADKIRFINPNDTVGLQYSGAYNELVVNGRIEANSGYFRGDLFGANITGATGTFSGGLSGASGSFGAGDQIQIDPAGLYIDGSTQSYSMVINNPFSGLSAGKSGLAVITNSLGAVSLVGETKSLGGAGVKGFGLSTGVHGISQSGTGLFDAGVRGVSNVSFTAGGLFQNTSNNVDVYIAGSKGVDARHTGSGRAEISARGSTSTGAGRFYVGQDSNYGGGIEFNGHSTHTDAENGSVDHVALYRRTNGLNRWVMQYAHNSNNASFRGTVIESVSDTRLKDIVEKLDPSESLMAVCSWDKFTYTAKQNVDGYEDFDTNLQVGFGAGSMQKTHPMLTPPAPFDNDGKGGSITGENYLTSMYNRTTPVLASAIEAIVARLEYLENQLLNKAS